MNSKLSWGAVLLCTINCVIGAIDRKAIVREYNLQLNKSNSYSPVSLGNGNFAFNTDITSLQTFLPHNTLSSWGWHNSSLPTTQNQTQVSDFTGLDWWTHGRLVNYDQPNPAEPEISQWLIANPHRINLGRIGLWFGGANVSEEDLDEKKQVMDLWSGKTESVFSWNGTEVQVQTVVGAETDTVAVKIVSEAVKEGTLGVFFDFPYASGANKFDAPFVGVWNATANHTTVLTKDEDGAQIVHTLDATTYFTTIAWEQTAKISGPEPGTHRYYLTAKGDSTLSFTATFAPGQVGDVGCVADVQKATASWWDNYWSTGAFVSLPTSSNISAKELQRRIILSQYLLAANEAGHDSPQESGLVNNGWYGKFHMEMVFWHLMHWAMWDKWDILDRSTGMYQRFLPSSFQRAQEQGYKGARLGKMSDPTGRSAPGEINSLLIWQEPHPMYFAEMEWRKFPTQKTLEKWDNILTACADFMTSYAWYNESTKVYDLGPPMYPVSENTNPNQTINPTFELAYFRFGLDVAQKWKQRQDKSAPQAWQTVKEGLANFPVQDGVYVLYEGVEDMWTTPSLAEDHPALLGVQGWLPPDARLNLTVFSSTIEKVYQSWNFTYSYGWDFPLLAMTAARAGDAEKAVDFLLDPVFQFDGLGMPVGGARVATPYFPASASLLLAVGMMAGGWDGLEGPVFPSDWDVDVEGFPKAM